MAPGGCWYGPAVPVPPDLDTPDSNTPDLDTIDSLTRARTPSPRESRFLPLRCFYSDRYVIPLPEGHPFPIEKYRETKEALLARGIIETVFDPGLADEGDLALVHTSEYIRSVFEGELSAEQLMKLGFPWSKALVDRSRSAVAGTVSAMGAAIEEPDGLGINLAGGTHHAFPDAGSGYCFFNDVAVGSLQGVRRGFGL